MWFVALSHHWILRRAHPVWYVCSDSHWMSWTFALNYLLMFGLRKRNFKKKFRGRKVWASDMFGIHFPLQWRKFSLKKRCKISETTAEQRCGVETVRFQSRSTVVGTPLGMPFWSLMRVSLRRQVSKWRRRCWEDQCFGWQTWSLKAARAPAWARGLLVSSQDVSGAAWERFSCQTEQ